MPNIIDICTGCGGQLRLVSYSREERIRMRIGKRWMARCRKCGVEVEVNSQAWRLFARQERAGKRAAIQPKQSKLF